MILKTPTGAVVIPYANPALGDCRCLISAGQAARFCQIALQSMGSNLKRFVKDNALRPAFVARVLAEKEASQWEDKPWERYWQQLTHAMAKLGFPGTVLWLSYPGLRGAKNTVTWLLRLTPGKARRLANVEKGAAAEPVLK